MVLVAACSNVKRKPRRCVNISGAVTTEVAVTIPKTRAAHPVVAGIQYPLVFTNPRPPHFIHCQLDGCHNFAAVGNTKGLYCSQQCKDGAAAALTAHRYKSDPEFREYTRRRGSKWRGDNKEWLANRTRERRASQRSSDPLYHRKWNLAAKYGMTADEFIDLATSQDLKCAICRKPAHGGRWDTLVVDHDHSTNAVRGLLCQPCNRGLGQFADDAGVVRSALLYLERHRT